MSQDAPSPSGERLAKVMSRAGLCSRRDAESWITAGRVSINGETVKSPAINVTERDVIAVDGKPIARREPTQAWIYHKPAGLMVTERDPEGRPTVFQEFDKLGLPRVVTVGRLDFSTEGLLILTNDGGLKRTLELPATGWVRRYRVRAFGQVTQEQLDGLKNGITVDGVEYGPIDAALDSEKGANVWLTLGLREGKNREVRNVLGALGLEVNRLIRISYGPFQLGDLPVGAVEKIKTRILKDQLGQRLANAAGADFDSPEAEDNQPRRRMPEKPASRAPERDRLGGGIRRRPERLERERPAERPRTLHFDDGRPSESFVPRGDGRRGRDERPARGGEGKRFSDGPRPPRREGDRPFGDRPPRRDGDRPFAKGPRRDGGKPFGDRPPRGDGDRPFGERPPHRDGDKPFAKGPRREGGKPFGDRPSRGDGDRPFGDRPPRGDGGKPFGGRPARRDGDKPFGDRPPRRDGDRPFTKNPHRGEAGAERPVRRERDPVAGERPPRRDGGKPFVKRGEGASRGDKPYGGKPGGKPGGRPYAGKPGSARPGAGRPSGPPRKPRRYGE